MCVHYWNINSENKGHCKLCGEDRDFQPALDKIFGMDKPFKVHLGRHLNPRHDYYMQGSIGYPHSYRPADFVLSVDSNDLLC